MEKIKSIFGKTENSGPKLESIGTDSSYDFDGPMLEGVEDLDDFQPDRRYNQMQTELTTRREPVRRTRRWGEPEFVFRPQEQSGLTEVQMDNAKMMYVEESEIDGLSEDIKTLNEIARDMSSMLEVQDEYIEKIDHNVEKSTVHVEKAGEEIEETLRLMKSTKYKRGAITTTGCAAIGAGIGVLGGPPGIAIGAGIGGAIGLVGSTVASIFN